jgi:tripartite-type tricarboxylate transporter receptor subunit TctC
MPYAPEYPTFAEEGFPNFEMSTWFSLFAPHGTPKDIVEKLNGFTRSVHDDPEIKDKLDKQFIEPLILTQPEFAALVKADAVKWERIVRESGLKPMD